MPQWSMRITAYAQRLLDGLDDLDWSTSMKEAQRNWIGRSEGASVRFAVGDDFIEVFTTRPDTLFGVSFITLAPEHVLVGKYTTDERRAEVEAYVKTASNRSERERQAEVDKVSGVFTGYLCQASLHRRRRADLGGGLCARWLWHRCRHGRTRR